MYICPKEDYQYHTSEDRCLWTDDGLVSLVDPSVPDSSKDSNLAIGASDDDFCFMSITPPPVLALAKYVGIIGSVSRLPGVLVLESYNVVLMQVV